MKTTLEIPDPTFRKAKATAAEMGIPLREYITLAVEEKLSLAANARASAGWNVRANWPISTRRPCGYRRSSTRNSNKSNLRTDLILDTNGLSAYLDSTPEAVEIVSGARELAIPVIVAGEFAFVSRCLATARRTKSRCSECWTGALSLILELRPRGTTPPSGWN